MSNGRVIVTRSSNGAQIPPAVEGGIAVLPVNDRKRTKIAICKDLFNPQKSRAQNIQMFMTQAGCTKAGPGTYYATINKQHA